MAADRSTGADLPTVPSGAPVAEAQGPRLSLVVYYREGAAVCPLPTGATVVLGRNRPADLVLNDPSLSRQHAKFVRVGQEVFVEDLGSTNGTRLKGKKVQRAKIRIGDAVWLGSVAVTLHALGTVEAELQGVESYEDFMVALEGEVLRARTFERPVGVLLLRAEGRTPARLDLWCPQVRALLRPVDRLALYGPNALLVCLLESGVQRTEELAQRVRDIGRDPPVMLCGWAVYPEGGTSAEELIAAVTAAAQRASPRRPIAGATAMSETASDVVVVSPRMKEIYLLAKRLASTPIPVLIQGETGAGKELVAQAIHDAGPRRRRPLRSLNCGAIPPSLLESALFGHERGAFTGADRQSRGVFEEADGGTLLLDEIGELSGPAQAALLRVLETQRFCRVGSSREIRVDVRVIAATHQDLEEMVHAGRFRADLLYRLNTMVIHVPPLRERPEEILPLAERFARRTSQASRRRTVRFDPAATAALRVYRWPGNVRELRNAIERAVILAVDDLITVEELPDRVRSTAPTPPAATPAGLPPDIRGTLDQVEAQLLLDALMANDWNQSRTAAALGMPRRTLVYKLRRYGIRRKDAS